MDSLLLKLRRIYRLSEKPSGLEYAQRHLDHIHMLCESLLEEIEGPAFDKEAAMRVELKMKAPLAPALGLGS